MRIFAAAFVVVIVAWATLSASAQDSKAKDGKKTVVGKPVKLTEHEKAAADFKFGSLKLGMSLKEVRKIFPKMMEFKGKEFNNKKVGKITYILRSAKPADFVLALFFEDKLYEMRVVYSHPQLSKIGGGEGSQALVDGATILMKKLLKKFGTVSSVEKSEDNLQSQLVWKFPKAKRTVDIRIIFDNKDFTESYARIDITDEDAATKIAAKIADTADTGF